MAKGGAPTEGGTSPAQQAGASAGLDRKRADSLEMMRLMRQRQAAGQPGNPPPEAEDDLADADSFNESDGIYGPQMSKQERSARRKALMKGTGQSMAGAGAKAAGSLAKLGGSRGKALSQRLNQAGARLQNEGKRQRDQALNSDFRGGKLESRLAKQMRSGPAGAGGGGLAQAGATSKKGGKPSRPRMKPGQNLGTTGRLNAGRRRGARAQGDQGGGGRGLRAPARGGLKGGPGGKAGMRGPGGKAGAIKALASGQMKLNVKAVKEAVAQMQWRGRIWGMVGFIGWIFLPFTALFAHKIQMDPVISKGIKEVSKPGSPAHLIPHPAVKIALRVARYIDQLLMGEWILAILSMIWVCGLVFLIYGFLIGIAQCFGGDGALETVGNVAKCVVE